MLPSLVSKTIKYSPCSSTEKEKMTKFVAIVSGKGGVGKTSTAINIGHALTEMGKQTVVVDANLATPNVGLHLGLIDPQHTLNQFMRKEKEISEVKHVHESGLSVIPASPSYKEYTKTNSERLVEMFEHLDNTVEFVIIDSPSGLGKEVKDVLQHSDEALIVVNPTRSSVMDALKTVEIAKSYNNTITGVLVNKSNRGRHELQQEEIADVLGEFILANVKTDKRMRKAQHQQSPLHYLYPKSKSAKEYKKIAKHLAHYP
jgi:septum site-determining protein MinD